MESLYRGLNWYVELGTSGTSSFLPSSAPLVRKEDKGSGTGAEPRGTPSGQPGLKRSGAEHRRFFRIRFELRKVKGLMAL